MIITDYNEMTKGRREQ